jgi:hypothetical protein
MNYGQMEAGCRRLQSKKSYKKAGNKKDTSFGAIKNAGLQIFRLFFCGFYFLILYAILHSNWLFPLLCNPGVSIMRRQE